MIIRLWCLYLKRGICDVFHNYYTEVNFVDLIYIQGTEPTLPVSLVSKHALIKHLRTETIE